KNKEIYNAEFTELYRYGFSRRIEDAWSGFDKKYAEYKEAGIGDLVYVSGGVTGIKKSLKILEKHRAQFPQEYEFFSLIADAPDMIKELKKYIIKGRKPKPADPNTFVRPPVSRQA